MSALICTHCDLPTTEKEAILDEGNTFCCTGCQMVYNFICSQDGSQYYDLKKTAYRLGKSRPVQNRTTDFSALDTQEGQRRYTRPIDDTTAQITFFIEGIHCSACMWLLERLPQFFRPVSRATLNLGTSQLRVDYLATTPASDIATFVAQLGYLIHPLAHTESGQDLSKKKLRSGLISVGLAGACAGNIMLFSICLYAGLVEGTFYTLFRFLSGALFVPILLISARPFFKNCLTAWRLRVLTIDLPIAIALVLGTAVSAAHLITDGPIYFDSLAVFVVLVLGVRVATAGLHNRLSNQLDHPFALIPQSATVIVGNTQKSVLTESLAPGDEVLVDPEQPLPADGLLLSDRAIIDSQILTGESIPQTVYANHTLYAGTVNKGPSFRYQVTDAFEASRLNQLLRKARDHRKPVAITLADRLSTGLTALVLILSVVLAIAFWDTPHLFFDRFLALLLVACPCAMALSIPLAEGLVMAKLARDRILVQNGQILDKLPQLKTVLVDKTGTLTSGKMTVVKADIDQMSVDTQSVLLAIEQQHHHPVASAISAYLSDQDQTPATEPIETTYLPGKGIQAVHNKDHYVIGPVPKQPSDLVSRIGVRLNDQLIGTFDISDELNPSAPEWVAFTTTNRIQTKIISGDHPDNVKSVQQQLGLDGGVGQCSPEDKKTLVDAHQPCLFIGDGVNDIAAMGAADCSIAIRGVLNRSLSACDAYVLDHDLSKIKQLIELATRFRTTVILTLSIALAYNSGGMMLAMLGKINPLLAAILMPVSSATVVLLSIWRLR